MKRVHTVSTSTIPTGLAFACRNVKKRRVGALSYKFKDNAGTKYYISERYRKRGRKRPKTEILFDILLAYLAGVGIGYAISASPIPAMFH